MIREECSSAKQNESDRYKSKADSGNRGPATLREQRHRKSDDAEPGDEGDRQQKEKNEPDEKYARREFHIFAERHR